MSPSEPLIVRALLLTRRHGVPQKDVLGAYVGHLGKIEFLLHEVAHWMTLGNDLAKKPVPRKLSDKVDRALQGMTPYSSNALEIDTAIVTYLAGYSLGLWSDPGPIAHSCKRNLRDALKTSEDDVYRMMVTRWNESYLLYNDMAHDLAAWLKPNAKLMAPTELTPNQVNPW